jgi:hypothetical protein
MQTSLARSLRFVHPVSGRSFGEAANVVNVHIHQFKPGGAVVDAAALAQFQEQWATYRKLITSNSLSHREVGGILRDTLNAVFASPFTFLDIACGDASVMKTALRGAKVRYLIMKLLVFLPFEPPCPYLGTSKEAPGGTRSPGALAKRFLGELVAFGRAEHLAHQLGRGRVVNEEAGIVCCN